MYLSASAGRFLRSSARPAPQSAHTPADGAAPAEPCDNEQLAAMGDRINAVTVSLDLPFAMNRFCGAESIKNMKVGSDYQDRNFGKNYGMLIVSKSEFLHD